jgi:DNA-directed RNA polymerase beta subunit
MLRKLYATVSGACCADNPDSPQHQEVLLPGSLYCMILKERMEEILSNIRAAISLDVRNGATVDFNDSSLFSLFITPIICNTIHRAIFRQSFVKSQLRCWCKTLKFSRNWQPRVAHGSRLATSLRFHDHRREIELAALYKPF